MEKPQFLNELEVICSLPINSLTGTETLKNIVDSLALLDFIAMIDNNFKINVSVDEIMNSKDINSLYQRLVNYNT